jgi:hypothetical protein
MQVPDQPAYFMFRVEGGCSNQMPRRSFKFSEIEQFAYSQRECLTVVANKEKSSPPQTCYCLSILFLDKQRQEISLFIEKQEVERMRATFAQVFPQDRRALLMIKQHSFEKWKQPISGGPGSLVSQQAPVQQVAEQQKIQIPFQQLDRKQATFAKHDENGDLVFDVSIRIKPNLKNVYFKTIKLHSDLTTGTLTMEVKGTETSYEIIQIIKRSN